MSRQKFPYRSDSIVRLVAPTDVVNSNPLDNTTDGATASFKVYDPAKDEALTAAEATGQTELSVTNAGVFVVADAVELELDDGSFHASTVSSIDPAAGTVTIADVLPSGAAAGNRFRRIFGAAVSMTEFGTPALETRDWGFQATLPDDHPAIVILDQEFDIEITFVGAVAGGLNLLEVICGVTKLASECEGE